MATFDINTVLKNFEDADKDLRFIALSDLANELPKESFKLEGGNEGKVVDGMIKLLYDVANEVQAQAIVCLTPLLNRINGDYILKITNALAEYTVDKQKAKKAKETCSSGLKVIVDKVGDDLGQKIADSLGPALAKGIQAKDEEIVSDCLDISKDMLRRFGSLMSKYYTGILQAAIPRLESSRNIIQLRAINCLGALAPYVPIEEFDKTIQGLISSLEKGGKDKAIYIQALGNLGSNAGPKLGKHVAKITPLLVDAINSGKEGEELSKESAFRTFESFLLSCRKDVGDFFGTILDLAQKFVKFDPLVEEEEGGEEEGGEEEGGEEEEGDDDDEDDDEDSEDEAADEDVNWKIRSAAAKVIGAAVSSTPAQLKELADKVCPILIKRFQEREHVVRHEVFTVFLGILRQLASYQLKSTIEQYVDAVVREIRGSLASKVELTKLDAIAVLKAIVEAVPNAYASHMKTLVPTVAKAATDEASPKLQTASFNFIRLLAASHKADTFLPYVDQLIKAVSKGASSKNAQVAVAASRTGASIVAHIPTDATGAVDAVNGIFKAVNPSFEAAVLDHSVKDAAILAISQIVAVYGDKVGDQKKILKNLVAKLGEESTRSAAARAFVTVSQSKLNIDFTSILADLVKELAVCLRQASRQITSDALSALNIVLDKYGQAKELKGTHATIISEVARLVSPKDVYQSGLAVALAAKVVASEPKSALDVQSSLYPAIEAVLKEAAVDGNEGAAFGALHAALAKAETKKFGFEEINAKLQTLAADPKVKENKLFDGIGRCIASLIANTDDKNAKKTLTTHISNVKANKDESTTTLGLAVIGHVGRQIDVSSYGDVQQVIAGVLSSTSQDITAAAGRALGDIAVGNIDKFLPFILENSKDPSKQYSVLNAMRQLVIGKSATAEGIQVLSKHLDNITPVLFAAKPKDEASQNLVAECLGKAATVAPSKIIPELHKRVSDTDTSVRATAVNSLCYIKYDSANATNIYEHLKPNISDFLKLIGDKELTVRDAAINGAAYVIDRSVDLVRSVLTKHTDDIYAQAQRCEFREIDYGPYKEYVDNTLKGREVIFSILLSLFDKCPEVIDPHKYVQCVLAAYRHDPKLRPQTDDIIVSANIILVKLTKLAPAVILSSLIDATGPIETEIKKKTETKVKKTALSAVAAITKIPNWESANAKFTEVVNKFVKGDEKLKQRYEHLLATRDLTTL